MLVRKSFLETLRMKTQTNPKMTANDVVGFLKLLALHKIDVWVDGGWGVDALLRRQTRPHKDLDIAMRHSDVPAARTLLEAKGYRDVPRDDTRDCNFVLGDDAGHQIDFHSFTFDDAGKCIFGCEYPIESLTGSGSIDGYAVKCISAYWMVKFHSGYTLTEKDYRDVQALCTAFTIQLPEEYDRFRKEPELEKKA